MARRDEGKGQRMARPATVTSSLNAWRSANSGVTTTVPPDPPMSLLGAAILRLEKAQIDVRQQTVAMAEALVFVTDPTPADPTGESVGKAMNDRLVGILNDVASRLEADAENLSALRARLVL